MWKVSTEGQCGRSVCEGSVGGQERGCAQGDGTTKRTHQEIGEVELCEEKAKRRGLHRGLDRKGAACLLVILERLAGRVGDNPTNDMQKESRHLQRHSSIDDGSCALGHGGAHKNASGEHAYDG